MSALLDWNAVFEQLRPLLDTGASECELFAAMVDAVEAQLRQQNSN